MIFLHFIIYFTIFNGNICIFSTKILFLGMGNSNFPTEKLHLPSQKRRHGNSRRHLGAFLIFPWFWKAGGWLAWQAEGKNGRQARFLSRGVLFKNARSGVNNERGRKSERDRRRAPERFLTGQKLLRNSGPRRRSLTPGSVKIPVCKVAINGGVRWPTF